MDIWQTHAYENFQYMDDLNVAPSGKAMEVFGNLNNLESLFYNTNMFRGGSRTAATSKMERFVIIVNGWKHVVTKITTTQRVLIWFSQANPAICYLQHSNVFEAGIFDFKVGFQKQLPKVIAYRDF